MPAAAVTAPRIDGRRPRSLRGRGDCGWPSSPDCAAGERHGIM